MTLFIHAIGLIVGSGKVYPLSFFNNIVQLEYEQPQEVPQWTMKKTQEKPKKTISRTKKRYITFRREECHIVSNPALGRIEAL